MKLGVRTPLQGNTLRERAKLIHQVGFDGIELGPEELKTTTDEILTQIKGTNITISAIVGSSDILNPDRNIRKRSIELDRERLQMAAELGASGVIKVPVFGPSQFPDASPVISSYELERKLLIAGLKELADDTERNGVPILIEPLNRYETHFINRVNQAVDIIREIGKGQFKVIPDFFHMNIEEKSINDALKEGGNLLGYVHLADSNRLQPGEGHTDFWNGLATLKSIGYDGWLTIESMVNYRWLANGNSAKGDVEKALKSAGDLVKRLWNKASK
jgi:sugar phosphate isomerase/epimerase